VQTIRITLDAPLLRQVDEAVMRLKTSRSAFTSRALQAELDRLAALDKEERQREGFARNPVTAGEFGGWDDEQVWPG
jgi:metal-responsive CopG/Arc/MetJ family transcriptional regulator